MYADITKPPPPLPKPSLQNVRPGLSTLAPLTRRGGPGPGVLVVVPDIAAGVKIAEGVPSPVVKWAEEGYAVAEIQASALANSPELLKDAIDSLKQFESCNTRDKFGLIVYDPMKWDEISLSVNSIPEIVAAVIYSDDKTEIEQSSALSTLTHVAGQQSTSSSKLQPGSKKYQYPTVLSSDFATPFTSQFQYNAEAVSHTRNLQFLKPKLGGPYYDLETLWDEHTYYEFADRSMEHTMSTMVQEPYVNHVPTLTGGVGREPLSQFYQHHFIFKNPPDAEMELISRTVGIDRVIDEFIFKFTHTSEVPWMLPGVPPTGMRIETPLVAVVNIRGDRLYHEHIHWDQGNVLRQLDLLPEYLPYPHALPDGKKVENADALEYQVPVSGIEVTQKMRDRNSQSSNGMFQFQVRAKTTVNGVNGIKGSLNSQANGISSR